jgi:hypothetical protein
MAKRIDKASMPAIPGKNPLRIYLIWKSRCASRGCAGVSARIPDQVDALGGERLD